MNEILLIFGSLALIAGIVYFILWMLYKAIS
ncbi:hypothetical protein [Citrobacter phage Ci1]|nr:hypothetical protein [Citrobacter phage Ci1]